MRKSDLSDINIVDEQVLITPDALKEKLPLSDKARQFIRQSRQTVADIIHKRDHRLLVVCGPCSIHDIDAAKELIVALVRAADASTLKTILGK